MKLKIIKYIALVVVCFVFSCGQEKSNKNADASSKPNKEITKYTYVNHGKDITVQVASAPKRAALFTPHITEMFLALGLEDKIVFGSKEGDVLDEFKEAFEKIPNKQSGHSNRLAKEAFLLLEPDFMSTDYPIEAHKTGDINYLLDNGILPYAPTAIINEDAKLEDVYFDFLTLGKIFDVEKKAETIVKQLKEKLGNAQKSFKNNENNKPKVLVMSLAPHGVWVSASLAKDLVKKANGINIFEDLHTAYEFVSFESVAERNPDVIFLKQIESSNSSISDKIKTLKEHPILKNVNAVKNNKIYEISFADVSPGIRNVDFIIKMNELIYATL